MKELNPRVVSVAPEPGYQLLLTFSNGEVKRFDMHPYLGMGAFHELQDEALFRTAKPALGTVVWDNGLDLCPDTLFLKSTTLSAGA